MAKITVTLEDGTQIQGDPTSDDFLAALKALGGEGEVYYSDKHGAMVISEMNVHHAQNAVNRMMKETADRLQAHLADPQQWRDGIVGLLRNKTFLALIAHVEENIK